MKVRELTDWLRHEGELDDKVIACCPEGDAKIHGFYKTGYGLYLIVSPYEEDTQYNDMTIYGLLRELITKTDDMDRTVMMGVLRGDDPDISVKTYDIGRMEYSDGWLAIVAEGSGNNGRTGDMGDFAAKASSHNGHEYVDLGLSVLWATCNVGAESPEGYGDYFAWGETKTKESYDEDNCETWKKEMGEIGGTDRDVAHVKWGGSWRLPTLAECNELIDTCDYEWTTLNGVRGGMFTNKKNGKSIFLPAAGWRRRTALNGTIHYGSYWSSTPSESYTDCACILGFGDCDRYTDTVSRHDGNPVRPVAGR